MYLGKIKKTEKKTLKNQILSCFFGFFCSISERALYLLKLQERKHLGEIMKTYYITILLAFIALLVGCRQMERAESAIAITGKQLVFLQNTLTLEVYFQEESIEQGVVWVSSDEAVATIDQGILTPKEVGAVTIYATYVVDGVTVQDAHDVVICDIALNVPEKLWLSDFMVLEQQVVVPAHIPAGIVLPTVDSITWSADNHIIGVTQLDTLRQEVTIEGKAVGNGTITATVAPNEYQLNFQVEVSDEATLGPPAKNATHTFQTVWNVSAEDSVRLPFTEFFVNTLDQDGGWTSLERGYTITFADNKHVYDFWVDWNDGSNPVYISSFHDPDATHRYDVAGSYGIEIWHDTTLDMSGWSLLQDKQEAARTSYAPYFTGVAQWGAAEFVDSCGAFGGTNFTVYTATDTPTIEGSAKAFFMFSSLNEHIDNWDMAGVTDTSWMFAQADKFDHSINSWDVSNVTDMSWMFRDANVFNQSVENWNPQNVTSMSHLFYNADKFNQDMSGWTNWSKQSDVDYAYWLSQTRLADFHSADPTTVLPPGFADFDGN